MSAYYLDYEAFSRLLDGLRSESSIYIGRGVYVDGPEMRSGPFDLVFDQPGIPDCFGLKIGGRKEERFHTWVLTETRHGRRIDLKWEHNTQAVIYEHREAAE